MQRSTGSNLEFEQFHEGMQRGVDGRGYSEFLTTTGYIPIQGIDFGQPSACKILRGRGSRIRHCFAEFEGSGGQFFGMRKNHSSRFSHSDNLIDQLPDNAARQWMLFD